MRPLKILSTIKLVLILAVVAAVVGVVIWFNNSDESDNVSLHKSKIKEVQTLVRLSSMDIYEDVPIKAHIGTKHLFARQKLHGTVSFDIEKLELDTVGDTIRVVLPPEIVEVYESVEPDSYKVIDTWNTKFMKSSNFTNSEENSIKAKAKDQWIHRQYSKGVIRTARKEAANNLRNLLSALFDQPVKVIDPYPNGYYFKKR